MLGADRKKVKENTATEQLVICVLMLGSEATSRLHSLLQHDLVLSAIETVE